MALAGATRRLFVARLACVDIPAFPLQLLCQKHEEWRGCSIVVIAEDKPQGLILWVNEKARQQRILPGQRYAYALSLAKDLRAGVISQDAIDSATSKIVKLLSDFSPEIEPYVDQPGVYWLNVAGLGRLFRTPLAWAKAIRAQLKKSALTCSVVVGYTRFATYATCRQLSKESKPGNRIKIFGDHQQETRTAHQVLLERLDLEPKFRDTLTKLGIATMGEFVSLPPGGLLERFGKEAWNLHRLARGACWDPLQPQQPHEPIQQSLLLDDPESNSTRLLFYIKRLLHPLLTKLAQRHSALATLYIDFELYRSSTKRSLEIIKPAEPTLDDRSLLRLVHLRLESSPVSAGVEAIAISAEHVRATAEQLALFAQKPRRDLRAANEAFARIRADLGNDSIQRVSIQQGHLPEAQYGWQRVEQAQLPKPQPPLSYRPLIRRIYRKPILLPPQNRQARNDGWLLRDLAHGPVTRLLGPYIISGGWWLAEIQREYHYAQTRNGVWLWVYFDKRKRRWFLHGEM